MQLGKLQQSLQAFKARGASVVALSIDQPQESVAMLERLGITFPLASDPDEAVVKAFGVQNPQTQELALHAVYIVAADGRVVYRKVARRRPLPIELLDALDAHAGTYPRSDRTKLSYKRVPVAFPTRMSETLIELKRVPSEPSWFTNEDRRVLLKVRQALSKRDHDRSVFIFRAWSDRRFADANKTPQGLDAAAWMMRQLYLDAHPDAAPHVFDDLSQRLKAKALSAKEREDLRFTKAILRGFRELVMASSRS